MNHPIKIIHKFKNDNRRVQYKIYIFIGSNVPNNIQEILNYIINKDFYSMLSVIKKTDYKTIEEYYGKVWYEYFYTSYHLDAQKKQINNTRTKVKILQDKFNKEWYNEHIHKLSSKQAPYSFSNEYYDYLLSINKIKNINKKIEIDYRTYNYDIQLGGLPTSEPENKQTDEQDDEQDDEQEVVIDDQIVEEEFNLDELSKLYEINDIENAKAADTTSKLISDALDSKTWEKKASHIEQTYDIKYDNITYDANLEDIYDKYYIKDQYIFKDNSIKIMKYKVATSIPLSNTFGKSIKLLPECQYFWSEYTFDNKKEYIMLGQKWVTRTELLKIDIKPNENSKIYEKLKHNLAYLKDNIGHKIKREDDNEKTLSYYDNYITTNEIFLLDIYNELGINYNSVSDDKRNFYNVFTNIYYPLISFERYEQIIDLLNNRNQNELTLIDLQFKTLLNDITLYSHIEYTMNKIKPISSTYNKFFNENHVIQSNIHVNLYNTKNITGTNLDTKFNLYRIYDNFLVDDEFPFIQYQTPDNNLTYKFTDMNENMKPLFLKWFENAPYGISFKMLVPGKALDKYLSITLHETGRLEYKITWTEDNGATMKEISETYNYIRKLLTKINSENKKIKIIPPEDNKFKYAFINTIQQFTLPEKFIINHNILSDFCRYFFPYISLVIEPKKRKAKIDISETSKYGTYIRYKRIDDFDNKKKMQMRILYYLKYFDLSVNDLVNEVAKQYNINNEIAAKEIDNIKVKYSKYLKRSGNIKKNLNMPKTKPPGIGIDIQGRDRDKYKIRITGVRNKEQLDDITSFIQLLIYLYVEIYLYKNPKYQDLKNTLKNLNNIAKRRNQVADIEIREYDDKHVKSLISLDKSRLGFRPEKGQHQWTRSCQNSGTDKKRRPDLTPGDQINKLLKDGYKLNPKTKLYEKQVDLKIRGKVVKTTLRAIGLSGDNNTINYFTCDPNVNKEHVYIGFLSKGNNPNDLCMPCCFIKDQVDSTNKKKQQYFNQCLGESLGQKVQEEKEIVHNRMNEKIYILQETNKIQDGRYIYLPKYLDIFFNKIWKHDHKIKNHYLLESISGYYFKYTIKNDIYFFLATIAHIYNTSIDKLIKQAIAFMEEDKNDIYFTYLNNGDIKTIFQTKEQYIKFLKTSKYLEYDIIGELLAIPGVITDNGIYYYVLNKKSTIIIDDDNEEQIIDDYYLDCSNPENNYMANEQRELLIMIKDEKYYFPIYFLQKKNEKQQFNIIKKFILDKPYTNVIGAFMDYFHTSCSNYAMNKLIGNNSLIAKNICKILNDKVNKQYIDERNKCTYLLLDDGLLLPVRPSGISYNYPIANITNIRFTDNIDVTLKKLANVEKVLKLEYKPKNILFDNTNKGNLHVVGLLLHNDMTIYIHKEYIEETKLKKYGFPLVAHSLIETLDVDILDETDVFDEHKENVNTHNYMTESYNLYKLELSHFICSHPKIKDKIINIVRNNNIKKIDKKYELYKLLLDMINNKLDAEYKITDNFTFIINKIPSMKNYVVNNIRDICKINNTENKCSQNLHCLWKNNKCKYQILDTMIYQFINRIIEEMIQDMVYFKELIEEDEYYVSDIVNKQNYTIRNNQQILKSTNVNVQKLLVELFENTKIPVLGKRQLVNKKQNKYNNIGEVDIVGNQYIQEIVNNADSIIRAYVNSYYWLNNKLYDNESRNLGYLNDLQTKLTYILKANIIDYLQTHLLKDNDANKYLLNSNVNKFRKLSVNTDGIMELEILSKLINVPIIVYDNYMNVKYIYMDGIVKLSPEVIKNYTSKDAQYNNIYIKFELIGTLPIPKKVYAIYYV
jgi:hypothetical protein